MSHSYSLLVRYVNISSDVPSSVEQLPERDSVIGNYLIVAGCIFNNDYANQGETKQLKHRFYGFEIINEFSACDVRKTQENYGLIIFGNRDPRGIGSFGESGHSGNKDTIKFFVRKPLILQQLMGLAELYP
uniref:Uncharacterized protein n=1 Tax=Romanomermis culicivorax TaxID=13658 RepID=A0A915HNM1_ROMCU